MNHTNTLPNLYALLIGVDYYLPGCLQDGSFYPSLHGCVRDITHVAEFLQRSKLNISERQILRLTVSNPQSEKLPPDEPYGMWPTYENMVAAFQQITETAQPGDHIYIHYSGHGGRTKTLIPERKGANGIDEALVPTDIHLPTARYLRDIELGPLFQKMVEKGLQLTVVLDSCHSGGVVRGVGNVAVRGLNIIDDAPRPHESLVASPQELAEQWDRLTERGTRNVTLGSGWLPEPKGYTLLAACLPTQSAYEYAFDGRERNGVLTYWLLDSLQKYGLDLSAKLLHERIVEKVHSQFKQQTPQLQGEGQNALFGKAQGEILHTATVSQFDPDNNRVRLTSVGQAFGNRKGAQFAIYPYSTTDFTDASQRQAIAIITEVGATDSWAMLTTRLSDAPLEQGAPAVLLDQGSLKLLRKVGLFAEHTDLSSGIDQIAAIEAIKAAMAGNPWIARRPLMMLWNTRWQSTRLASTTRSGIQPEMLSPTYGPP